MRCKICGKLIRENTDGNLKYCQGHNFFEIDYWKNKKRGKEVKHNI